MGGMEKTTVYLTTDQKRALEEAAHTSGHSEARLIRAGIEAVTAPGRASETAAPFRAGQQTEDGRDTVRRRTRWMPRDELIGLLRQGADAGLRAELRRLAPDTTDDMPIR